MVQKGQIRYFLASKTDRGFVSYFERLLEADRPGAILLKGGPGSGKSTLLKRTAALLAQAGHEVELIPCASDPDSLDAIVDCTTGRAVIDGTAPHMMDPVYPGARDVLMNAGDAWDEATLRPHAGEVIRLSDEANDCHAQASAYICAAGALLRRCRQIASRYVDGETVRALARSLRLPVGEKPQAPEYRLLSAVSVGRMEFFKDTIDALCERKLVVADEWGEASSALIGEVKRAAEEANQRIILCPCSVCRDKLDHILLPDIGLCVSCANSFHDASAGAAETIGDLYRPVPAREGDAMRALVFHARELIALAQEQVALSKEIHDELERYYVAAMDFSKLDPIRKRVMEFLL
ncbi:MAG TPA: hypothetical protein VN540_10725 [Clostridia bacterium]|nr:hypothetical protein [Clostridia bacterium]